MFQVLSEFTMRAKLLLLSVISRVRRNWEFSEQADHFSICHNVFYIDQTSIIAVLSRINEMSLPDVPDN